MTFFIFRYQMKSSIFTDFGADSNTQADDSINCRAMQRILGSGKSAARKHVEAFDAEAAGNAPAGYCARATQICHEIGLIAVIAGLGSLVAKLSHCYETNSGTTPTVVHLQPPTLRAPRFYHATVQVYAR